MNRYAEVLAARATGTLLLGMLIRAEQAGDRGAVHDVNRAAFPTRAEADLVDRLREEARPVVSLVAEIDGAVVGHILFTPVSVSGRPDLALMGLAPMAVTPSRQRQGVGSALVRAGLAGCKQIGCGAVVVLGHPEYYPRFGFRPAGELGLGCEYEAPAEAFMAVELREGFLNGVSGTVRFHPAFDGM